MKNFVDDLLNVQGKVAVITGGASGIGLATARLFAKVGMKVAILDINESLVYEKAEELSNGGDSVAGYKCDVTSEEDCKKVTSEIVDRFGRIDVLFNNAGIITRKTVVDHTSEEWDRVINVSLKGVFLLSKYVIPVIEKSGGGSIINTGSGWGLKGGDHSASYCAAKAGVVNLTRAMAIDHGPSKIRVNSINPGDTDTPLLRGEAKQLNVDEEAFLKSSGVDRPLARIGTPDDIAKSVLFLASDLAEWMTGSSLVVDGGGLA
ncbi:glucose 1-dehydrogenase [Sporosarcina saromensis]|uniref:Glucose 1-dehydrogenase n=1 Tax=Sporosarcina saromensis TaxID=359365 RepID=A0ABU4G9R3_9BACL|nr:glucose 1-dehydrogenase [Sporosarcina saromensis]MDW0113080.1 glucose 1-dehydrogenase [Sporosarcina saromensis]